MICFYSVANVCYLQFVIKLNNIFDTRKYLFSCANWSIYENF